MPSKPAAHTTLLALLLTYEAYVSIGLPDGVMGAAWPQLRDDFGVPLNANWPIYAAGLVGGLISGVWAGAILRRISIGRLLLLTTLLTSISLAACGLSPWFPPLIGIGFLLGLGNSAIDVGMNHFVATHLSSRHMNWLHASWGLGVSSGTLIISGVASLHGSWRTACFCIAGLQGLLALCFYCTGGIWDSPPSQSAENAGRARAEDEAPPLSTWATLRTRVHWLSLGCFFLYCGIEFSTGVWTTSLLETGRHWAADTAALLVTLYWASLTAGRFAIGSISNRLRPISILRLALCGVLLGTLLISFSSLDSGSRASGVLTAAGLLVTGFSLAPIYPTMMHDTPACSGPRHAVNLIGLQAACANIGLTMIPGVLGTCMRHSSLEYLGPCLVGMALLLFVLVNLRERHRLAPSVRRT